MKTTTVPEIVFLIFTDNDASSKNTKMLFSSKKAVLKFHIYNRCLLYIMSYDTIIITLSLLIPFQQGRKNLVRI